MGDASDQHRDRRTNLDLFGNATFRKVACAGGQVPDGCPVVGLRGVGFHFHVCDCDGTGGRLEAVVGDLRAIGPVLYRARSFVRVDRYALFSTYHGHGRVLHDGLRVRLVVGARGREQVDDQLSLAWFVGPVDGLGGARSAAENVFGSEPTSVHLLALGILSASLLGVAAIRLITAELPTQQEG